MQCPFFNSPVEYCSISFCPIMILFETCISVFDYKSQIIISYLRMLYIKYVNLSKGFRHVISLYNYQTLEGWWWFYLKILNILWLHNSVITLKGGNKTSCQKHSFIIFIWIQLWQTEWRWVSSDFSQGKPWREERVQPLHYSYTFLD